MIWPIENHGSIHYVPVIIRGVYSDEAEGELLVRITAVGETREHEIIYTEMYYSQLDNSCLGLTLFSVSDITADELNQQKHSAAAMRLMTDCSADDDFLRQMTSRGNKLYMHYTEDGGEYIVLAKRMRFDSELK
jgi:hypothetical protein